MPPAGAMHTCSCFTAVACRRAHWQRLYLKVWLNQQRPFSTLQLAVCSGGGNCSSVAAAAAAAAAAPRAARAQQAGELIPPTSQRQEGRRWTTRAALAGPRPSNTLQAAGWAAPGSAASALPLLRRVTRWGRRCGAPCRPKPGPKGAAVQSSRLLVVSKVHARAGAIKQQ